MEFGTSEDGSRRDFNEMVAHLDRADHEGGGD